MKAVGENNRIETLQDTGRQLDAGLLHLYGQKKKAARRASDKVRNYI